MIVKIDSKAKKYIDKQGQKSVTIDIDGCSSWGVEPNPVVNLGKPKEDDIDDFDKYTVDGIDVYVVCTANTKNGELTLSYMKILFSGKLVVNGLAL